MKPPTQQELQDAYQQIVDANRIRAERLRRRRETVVRILLAFLALVTLVLANQWVNSQDVHLRMYAGEPYLERAAAVPEGQRPFNSVWVTRKYYPDFATDANNGDPKAQAAEVRSKMAYAESVLKIKSSPGYGLHPINWLSKKSWQMRADALEAFIVAGNFEGEPISFDIEGYGYQLGVIQFRTPPPKEPDTWQALIEACSPIRYVLLKYRMRPTIYPAGGPKFHAYTRAALALGATRLGDEYSFIFSQRIREGYAFTREDLKFWKRTLTNTDPDNRGIHFIPGLLSSNFNNASLDRIGLQYLGIKECWLFVDDKNFLLPEGE